MTSFFAVLKDSYREAKDGWIFHAMLVLAGLFMLFVSSISFRPITPLDDIDGRFRLINFVARQSPEAEIPEFKVENYRQTNPSEVAWKGNYEFEFVASAKTPAALTRARASGMPMTTERVELMFEQDLSYLKGRTVRPLHGDVHAETLAGLTGVPAAAGRLSGPDNEARFVFSSTGTTIDDPLAWRHEPTVLFFVDAPILRMSLRQGLYRIEKTMVNDFGGWAAMLVSIVVTAAFVPNMLRKGSLDLLIAKPISRVQMLLYKYVGGLLFVLILATVTVAGVWLIIGIRTGIWSPNFLLVIPIMTFYFAILYAISVFVAVLTRNTLVAILAAVMMWGLVWAVGLAHDAVDAIEKSAAKAKDDVRKSSRGRGRPVNKEKEKEDAKSAEAAKAEEGEDELRALPAWVEPTARIVRKALPRTYDLDSLAGRLIAEGVLTKDELKQKGYDEPPMSSWPEAIAVSVFDIFLLLALACWRFIRRDG